MPSQGAVGKGRREIVAINSIVILYTHYHRKVIVAIYPEIPSVTRGAHGSSSCISAYRLTESQTKSCPLSAQYSETLPSPVHWPGE